MEHQDHVDLIRKGIRAPGGTWADFGSGTGAFTLALADLIGPEGEIYSIDKDQHALAEQQRRMTARFPERPPGKTYFLRADFTQPLDLPSLDGIVMANSLHFQKKKELVLAHIREYLKPGGRLILVEYNADRGNPWVPYPLSYPTWEALAQRSGFSSTVLLNSRPSSFLREIYSALSFK